MRLAIAATCAAFLAGTAAPAGAANVAVALKDNYVGLPYRLINVGDTVVWTNEGSQRHTVVSYPDAAASFDSSPDAVGGECQTLLETYDCIEPGETYEVSFDQPGMFEYYCKVSGHADTSVRPDPDIRVGTEQPCGMCGIIQVKEKSSPRPLPSRSRPTDEATQTEDERPAKSPTESATPTAPEETLSPDPVASTGGGGRLAVAFGLLVVLGGAGYLVWRRFLA